MSFWEGAALVLLLAGFLWGCSWFFMRLQSELKIENVKDKTDSWNGPRFYRPAPYILVTRDQSGVKTAAVVMLPDKAREYEVSVTKGFSKADLKVALEGGWNLTSLGVATESLGPALLTSIAGIAAGATPATKSVEEPLRVELYRLDFDTSAGWRVVHPPRAEQGK